MRSQVTGSLQPKTMLMDDPYEESTLEQMERYERFLEAMEEWDRENRYLSSPTTETSGSGAICTSPD